MSKKRQKASSGTPVNHKIAISPTAMNEEQKAVLKSIYENQITIVHGPAGSGKSYLATLVGMDQFLKGKFDKLIFTRPCVEAYGESLGFLPGNLAEKILPYLAPLINILEEKFDNKYIMDLMRSKEILTIPFAFLRGLTFKNSFVIADECQNSTTEQMRLLLTRMGENSKAVITGDLRQADRGGRNGLRDAVNRLQGVSNLGICELTSKSIVRSKIVADIEERYEKLDNINQVNSIKELDQK